MRWLGVGRALWKTAQSLLDADGPRGAQKTGRIEQAESKLERAHRKRLAAQCIHAPTFDSRLHEQVVAY